MVESSVLLHEEDDMLNLLQAGGLYWAGTQGQAHGNTQSKSHVGIDDRDEVIIPVEKREKTLHSRTRHEGHKY